MGIICYRNFSLAEWALGVACKWNTHFRSAILAASITLYVVSHPFKRQKCSVCPWNVRLARDFTNAAHLVRIFISVYADQSLLPLLGSYITCRPTLNLLFVLPSTCIERKTALRLLALIYDWNVTTVYNLGVYGTYCIQYTQDICSYRNTIICMLRSGHQYTWWCGDKDAKRMVDFSSFVFFFLNLCFVKLLFYSVKFLEYSVKCTAQTVAACTPTLRTDSGMDSSGTNMHIDLANIIIPGKQ